MNQVQAQTWGFLTNHALVLIYVIRHPDSTVREISAGVEITDRATLSILRQLNDDGIMDRHRDGRRNTYAVNFDKLAAYRRVGTVSLTPRLFVDALIQTLLDIAQYHGMSPSANGRDHSGEVDSGSLDPMLGSWGFFTNHSLLLLAIAMDSQSTVREMAASVGITERAVVAILNQLEDGGIIVRERQGRRNSYVINLDALRHFPRWAPGDWEFPPQLVEVAVAGLRALMREGD
jgi:DNA-binding MarR family transcriptional regulator